jgi:hypothetical protein
MRNEAPSRSLVRRANQVKTLALLVGALGVFAVALGVFLSVIPLIGPTSPSYGVYTFIISLSLIVGALLLIAALALAVRAFTWKTDNDLAMIVGRLLANSLDSRFSLIRNVSKREIGYVDAVLVGPPGALVMRILDVEGTFANEGANWLSIKRDGENLPAPINPTNECIADIRKVREYLDKRQLPNVPVYGVVIFMKEEPRVRLSARDPLVPITHLQSLVVSLQPNYLAKDRIDQPTVEAVRRHLFGG